MHPATNRTEHTGTAVCSVSVLTKFLANREPRAQGCPVMLYTQMRGLEYRYLPVLPLSTSHLESVNSS